MNNLFLFLFLLSFIALIVGIVKPTLVIKWGHKRTRKEVLKTYTIALIAFFVLFSLTLEPAYNTSDLETSQNLNNLGDDEIGTGSVNEDLNNEDNNNEKGGNSNKHNDEYDNLDDSNNLDRSNKTSNNISKSSDNMIVHFIDVGQGDATLVQTPGGKTILIDAGDRHMGSRVVSYIKSLGIENIDLLIGTHPHADHIGGMGDVINNFNVGTISMPKVTHTSQTFENLLAKIQKNGLTVKNAKAGVVFELDHLIELKLVAPNSPRYSILNDYSAALKITYGESSFLITGDAEINSEMEMVTNSHNLNVDVLRTGHHGSGTSSTTQFLNSTSPKYAIISVGKGNRYNHPSREVLTRLDNINAQIYRTDVHGTIIFETDGQTYDINIRQPYQVAPPKKIDDEPKSEPILSPKPVGYININTASFEELQGIINIGPERAQEIINKRPFASLDGLSSISGIGPTRLKQIRDEGKAYVQ